MRVPVHPVRVVAATKDLTASAHQLRTVGGLGECRGDPRHRLVCLVRHRCERAAAVDGPVRRVGVRAPGRQPQSATCGAVGNEHRHPRRTSHRSKGNVSLEASGADERALAGPSAGSASGGPGLGGKGGGPASSPLAPEGYARLVREATVVYAAFSVISISSEVLGSSPPSTKRRGVRAGS